jgi:hypothetical protein
MLHVCKRKFYNFFSEVPKIQVGVGGGSICVKLYTHAPPVRAPPGGGTRVPARPRMRKTHGFLRFLGCNSALVTEQMASEAR